MIEFDNLVDGLKRFETDLENTFAVVQNALEGKIAITQLRFHDGCTANLVFSHGYTFAGLTAYQQGINSDNSCLAEEPIRSR